MFAIIDIDDSGHIIIFVFCSHLASSFNLVVQIVGRHGRCTSWLQ